MQMDKVSNFNRCSPRCKHVQKQLSWCWVCINLSSRTFLKRDGLVTPLIFLLLLLLLQLHSWSKQSTAHFSVCLPFYFHGLKMKNDLPESLSHVESRKADSSQRRGPKYWRSLQREKLSLSLSRSLSDSRSLSAVRRRLLVLPRLKNIQKKFQNNYQTT